ncbi:hypothetical protein Lal_00031204 [Lupinus albus]|uniref:Putative ATP-dependent Clp protease ATP-binding subunit ClpA n=1 Tax=Lupinus albus TaxID=3870 RepID=A0A6A4P6I6_LUPAL|nr:putative ATP-dependent Clp protease ATP-binding subunit ClpA [Lupinus albus]KAF1864045.1 hypothetical protein Lal_00031204 [Lupinus albus]
MPTPLSAARQCLTDEAARALDDASLVARRRCHAQTTSLHAVSALLSLPSSALRDACIRARTTAAVSSPYSPRQLHLRALELSVSVSLDRLPSSKSAAATADDDGPPVSNSLMAAIKRSQANQRRHPDSFYFIHQNGNGTTSFLKVELKHFVLSVLDDPIVSRVLCEAGFRSCDVKLALLQPPPPPPPPRTRFPPVFLCNLEPGRTGLNPPFIDDNSRRIVEILVKKRNLFLMGIYAKGALKSFIELIQKGYGGALFPSEMASLKVLCIEKEIAEFVGETGNNSEDRIRLRLEELGCEVEQCKGSSVVLSFGEVEVFVGDCVKNVDNVKLVVSGLTRLLEIHHGKIWLVGVAETSDAYSKFLGLFPNVEKDWDLHLLTITYPTPSMEGLYPKSSLMGSFVPFAGFFSTPSEIKSPAICTNVPFARCDKCNEKCEEEVADIMKACPATLASGYSTSLPWLQKVNADMQRGPDAAKANEENTSLNGKILELQKKWNDICQRLHQTRALPEFEGLRFGSSFKESSSNVPSHKEIQYSSGIAYMPKQLHDIFPSKQLSSVSVPFNTVSVNTGTDHGPKVSVIQQTDMQIPLIVPSPMANVSVLDHRLSSSLTPVITDLGLGTLLYTSAAQEPDTPKLRDHKKHLQHLSDSLSTGCDALNENASHQIVRSSPCSSPYLEGNFHSVDFKSLNQLLNEKVGWQDEAICAINRTLFLCKSGAGKRRGSRVIADIWFAFLGPDRVGKRKIASSLAEVIFGNTESLISVDLSSQGRLYPLNSIFESQKSYCHDMLGRKTVADYIAGELSKKPHSVVFLENVDKGDFLVQTSLLQAMRTGKFRDSRGREISINNAIFIVASTVCKGNDSFAFEESNMFSEERILEAKRCQMQLLLGDTSEGAKISSSTNVKVVPRKGYSKSPFLNKRKQNDGSECREGASCKTQKQASETSRSYLDLNMPVEDTEEVIDDHDHGSESVVKETGAWLSDFCNQIDEKVIFKPFNFNLLAEKVLKRISIQFETTFGSESQLEIDYEVMTQILASAWLSDKKNAMDDWVESVLLRGFIEAQKKYHPAAQCVMKLVNSETIFVEEQAHGVCLPARINLH